jgi:uncharacterized protein (DUF2141 family)
MSKIFSILFFLFLFCFKSNSQNTTTLTIKILNIKTVSGQIRIGFYNSASSFPAENKTCFNKIVKPKNIGEISIPFTDIPYGTYAIAIYHDKNENKKLDKNLVGYPKEPFAFSNNFKPLISAPKFSDCSFEFSKTNKIITIKLL